MIDKTSLYLSNLKISIFVDGILLAMLNLQAQNITNTSLENFDGVR